MPWPTIEQLIEDERVPDPVLRRAIRAVLRLRLRQERAPSEAAQQARHEAWLDTLRQSPIAQVPDAANAQHYEVPAGLFEAMLGPRLKYSCALFDGPRDTLAQAETAMLDVVASRAQLRDGQRVLDLGCGWGSFALYAAARYPQSQVTGVSNSRSQRAFIEGRARALGLSNLRVVTADVNDIETWDLGPFDRVVSIEMFEHVRNYARLLRALAGLLDDDGRLFVHHFAHHTYAYPYEVNDQSDWMAKNFFAGGQMPSADLLLSFQDDLVVTRRFRVDGTHYQRTCEAWLARLDAHRDEAEASLAAVVGPQRANRDVAKWRVFVIACAELFGFRHGREWQVLHYVFAPRGRR